MIETVNLCKTVLSPEGELQILKAITFKIDKGESLAIVGTSRLG
jgi:predicted ABC-type transport system involved in lysophospholipase L1 biosynthesis ATPase subunit